MHIIRVSITGNYVHWQLDVCISGKDQKAAPVCVVQCDLKLSVINQIQIVVSWKKEVVLQMILNCASSYVFQTWMDSKVVRIALHEEHFFRVEVLACSEQWVISMSQWPIFSGKHNVNRATHSCRLSQLTQILDCERNRKKENLSTWPQCFVKSTIVTNFRILLKQYIRFDNIIPALKRFYVYDWRGFTSYAIVILPSINVKAFLS